jgi:hypothetical protein
MEEDIKAALKRIQRDHSRQDYSSGRIANADAQLAPGELNVRQQYTIRVINDPNGEGVFYVSKEDYNRIKEEVGSINDNVKKNIINLLESYPPDKFFINFNDNRYYTKSEGITEVIKTTKAQKAESDKEIQDIANRAGSDYFNTIIKTWNNGKPDVRIFRILKARKDAVMENPDLAIDNNYTYGLTVRKNKNSDTCNKPVDLSVPDGAWRPLVTESIDDEDKERYKDVISAVNAERNCSAMNQAKSRVTSAFSNIFSRSSSSPAAGGRRTKKRSSRRARKTRVKARKSGRRARARRTRK